MSISITKRFPWRIFLYTLKEFDLLIYLVASLHKCGKSWKRKDRANILRHLESCQVASECLVRSRSPRSKNVIGVAQMDRVWLCNSKTAKHHKTLGAFDRLYSVYSGIRIKFQISVLICRTNKYTGSREITQLCFSSKLAGIVSKKIEQVNVFILFIHIPE